MEPDHNNKTQESGYTLDNLDLYARRAECAALRQVILRDLSIYPATTHARIRDLAGVTYQRAQRELVEMVQDGTLESCTINWKDAVSESPNLLSPTHKPRPSYGLVIYFKVRS